MALRAMEEEETGKAGRAKKSRRLRRLAATAKCKEVKSLRVKKLILGEATNAEPNTAAAEVRMEAEAVGRAAAPGAEEPRPTAQQP